jgi:hypothetical protein
MLLLSRRASATFAASSLVSVGLFFTGSAPADTTIGADVTTNAQSLARGTCQGGPGPGPPACVIVTNKPTPGITSTGVQELSPCDGTVTGFRINGVPTVNTYRLRVVQITGGTTGTAVSSSAPVSLMVDGVNLFPAMLPIKAGNQIGLEWLNDVAFQSVRYRSPAESVASFLGGIPESGSATGTTGADEYLVNADIECGTPTQPKKCKKKKAKKKSAAAAKKKKKGCKKKKKR